MKVRVASVDEYQFLTCLKYGLWGANTRRSVNWEPGDMLIFSVNKKITALAQVIGEPFTSSDIIWDDGLYPYRVKLSFVHVLSENCRIPVDGEVKALLINSWGTNYGIGILNKTPLSKDAAKDLIGLINIQENSLQHYNDKIDEIIKLVKRQRELEYKLCSEGTLESWERKFKDKIIQID